jgi:ubiquinone/menaquinone biosynthesis C-methylase UbiE
VDPSENVHRNEFVHERVQCLLEDFRTDRRFDLATLRMVVEHAEQPKLLIGALDRLLLPGGLAVVLTVNLLSPIATISRFTPFWLHHPVKKLIWGGEEEDTFPVCYQMNTRRRLRALFEAQGFREAEFEFLDDLSAFGKFRWLNLVELSVWKLLKTCGVRYPENCLLGIYLKSSAPGHNPR